MVNPERFGLKKIFITKLYPKVAQKADISILLYDEPEYIYRRKPELPVKILTQHQLSWIKLHRLGEIEYLIRINRAPYAIANEIKTLILSKFNNYIDSKTDYNPELWVQSFFNAYHERQSYPELVLIKFNDGRGFIVNYKFRRSITNSLSLYSPASKKARLLKNFIQLSFKCGFAKYIFNKIHIDQTQLSSFLRFINSLFPELNVINFSISLGAPGPKRKIVFCLMDLNGSIIAFAKIANKEAAIEGLKTEANILKNLNSHKFHAIDIPEVLYEGRWKVKYCLVTSALDSKKISHKSMILEKEEFLNVVKDFSKINYSAMVLVESDFFLELQKMVNHIKTPYLKHLCEDSLEIIIKKVLSIQLPFHFSHGDFTPWNMYNTKPKVGVFDFEYAIDSAPAGFDVIRYYTQVMILIRKTSKYQVHKELTEKIGWYKIYETYLLKLNIDLEIIDRIIHGVYGLYLIYHICIYENDRSIFSENMKTFSYLLNLFIIEHTILKNTGLEKVNN